MWSGCGIAAVFVVAEDHLRLEVPDQPDQRGGGTFQRLRGEGTCRQRRKRVAFGQPGVHEAQPALADAQDLGRLLHLQPAGAGHVPLGVRLAFHRRVLDVAAGAVGAGGHHDVHAGRGVHGHGGGALAGFVVRVGMDGEQPKRR